MTPIEDLLAMVMRGTIRLITSWPGEPDHRANRSRGQKNRRRRAVSEVEKFEMSMRYRAGEDSQAIADDYRITIDTLRNIMSKMRVRRKP